MAMKTYRRCISGSIMIMAAAWLALSMCPVETCMVAGICVSIHAANDACTACAPPPSSHLAQEHLACTQITRIPILSCSLIAYTHLAQQGTAEEDLQSVASVDVLATAVEARVVHKHVVHTVPIAVEETDLQSKQKQDHVHACDNRHQAFITWCKFKRAHVAADGQWWPI